MQHPQHCANNWPAEVACLNAWLLLVLSSLGCSMHKMTNANELFLVCDVIVSGENLSFILPARAWGPSSLVPLLLLCTVSPVVFPGLRLCRAWLRWGSYIEGNEWDPVIHLVCGEWVWLWYCPQKDVSALPWFHILGSHRSLLCSCQAHESLKWWQVQQGCSFCSQHTFLQSWWSSWKLVALNILTRIGKGTHSLFPFNFSELFSFPYCLAATRW